MSELPANRGQRLQLLFLEQEKQLYRRSLTKRDLQKLLFLYLKDSGRHDYSFVPLKYGCYSFVGDRDIRSLESLGWIELGRQKVRLLEKLHLDEAGFALERQEVREWLKDNSPRGKELVADSYRSDPYCATNSVILDSLRDLGLLDLKDIREIQIDFICEPEDKYWKPEYLQKLARDKQQLNLLKDTSIVEEDFKVVNKLPCKFSYVSRVCCC